MSNQTCPVCGKWHHGTACGGSWPTKQSSGPDTPERTPGSEHGKLQHRLDVRKPAAAATLRTDFLQALCDEYAELEQAVRTKDEANRLLAEELIQRNRQLDRFRRTGGTGP